MRVLGFIPLHYGLSYLGEAIKSIDPFVEKIVILYSEKPSYGFGTDVQCPETEQQLLDCAMAASPKVEWHKIFVGNEGEHRAAIYKYSDGYDLILSCDSDEIFDQNDLPIALDLSMKTDKRYIGIGGYINFWRSFNYACYDGFTPIRITNLHNSGGSGVVPCKIYHFSTAQSFELMDYKLRIHGHKSEIREGWFENIYKAWKPGMVIDKGLQIGRAHV